jgi:anaerobic magnesium-protoporphyrin IX monomethyl ester cyclase
MYNVHRMKIVLVNPPHTAIGSRIPDDHLPPLGLLSVGGPLIDAGHNVVLIDAEFGPMSFESVADAVFDAAPDIMMIGHSGSTSAHPTALAIAERIKLRNARILIVYGGVFPTYHWRDILGGTNAFDVIVRGEGEDTIVRLVQALEKGENLEGVKGIAFRDVHGNSVDTPPAQAIANLDGYRTGWELIDHRRYSYWGANALSSCNFLGVARICVAIVASGVFGHAGGIATLSCLPVKSRGSIEKRASNSSTSRMKIRRPRGARGRIFWMR